MENENNNLKNLPPFYVGQKVVYVTGNCMPKHSIHTIHNITQHVCGCWCVDIGLKLNRQYTTYCCHCGNKTKYLPSSDIDWFTSRAFRPLQSQSFPLISLSKVIEKQLVSAN